MEKLEKIQRRALRYCLSLRRSTPTNALLAESGVPSLIHRFHFLASKFITKSFALQDNILTEKLYDLQIHLINSNCHNIPNNFLLYKVFIALKKQDCKLHWTSGLLLSLRDNLLFSQSALYFTKSDWRHKKFPSTSANLSIIISTSLLQNPPILHGCLTDGPLRLRRRRYLLSLLKDTEATQNRPYGLSLHWGGTGHLSHAGLYSRPKSLL